MLIKCRLIGIIQINLMALLYIDNAPRNVQIVSVLLECEYMLHNQGKSRKDQKENDRDGLLLQVKTGEGKSTIVAILAAALVLGWQFKVDIVCFDC